VLGYEPEVSSERIGDIIGAKKCTDVADTIVTSVEALSLEITAAKIPVKIDGSDVHKLRLIELTMVHQLCILWRVTGNLYHRPEPSSAYRKS
jgi:hypothetical protein